MKNNILTAFIILASNMISAQSFLNGDLEGVINGPSTLPPSWHVVSSSDINCQADPGGNTPDLTNFSQPDFSAGMNGNPYSGNSFVAGSYGVGDASGTTFQEGIMQDLTGFSIGMEYVITFYQSVVKTIQSLDTSGSWMIIVDDSIIGITTPTISQEPFNSTSFLWESRSVSFFASNTSHTIKFLPLDDDNDLLSSPTNMNGSLHMGIDLIDIQPAITTELGENNVLIDIKVFPNPTRGNIMIYLGSELIYGQLSVYNSLGIKLHQSNIRNSQSLNLTDYPSGIYHLQFITDFGIINKSILKN